MTKRKGTEIYFVLVLTFTILKLMGAIDWSWWAVLVPLWIWLVAIVLVIVLAVTGNLDD